MADNHNIRVGHLVKLEARRRALAKVSEERALDHTAEPAQLVRSGS